MKKLFLSLFLFVLLSCGKESSDSISSSPTPDEKGTLTLCLTDQINYARALDIAKMLPHALAANLPKVFIKLSFRVNRSFRKVSRLNRETLQSIR